MIYLRIILTTLFWALHFTISAPTAAAQTVTTQDGYDHGWCVGRSNLILSVLPENIDAQTIARKSERAFYMDGLEVAGASTSGVGEKLTDAILQIRRISQGNAHEAILQHGRAIVEEEIRIRFLPEMLRVCRY